MKVRGSLIDGKAKLVSVLRSSVELPKRAGGSCRGLWLVSPQSKHHRYRHSWTEYSESCLAMSHLNRLAIYASCSARWPCRCHVTTRSITEAYHPAIVA